MRGTLTYIITLWVGLGVSYTQPNLILNPSVEDIDSCYDIGLVNFKYIQYWNVPNKSSPDYYHTCHTNNETSVPSNIYDFQYPKDGNAYFGIAATDILPGGAAFEAVQGTFSEKLQKGRKYCFDVYTVRSSLYGYATGEFGIYLSDNMVQLNEPNCLSLAPYTPLNINYLADTMNWTKFSVEINNYEDDIQYFVLSVFQKAGDFQMQLVDPNAQNPHKVIYYLFDDFALYDCGEADTLPDTVDTASVNFPTVFTPNGDGINDVLHMEGLPPGSNLEVYNRWGDIVHKAYPYTEPWDGNKNGHPCPEGVYHYIVQLPDGQTVRKFVHLFR